MHKAGLWAVIHAVLRNAMIEGRFVSYLSVFGNLNLKLVDKFSTLWVLQLGQKLGTLCLDI